MDTVLVNRLKRYYQKLLDVPREAVSFNQDRYVSGMIDLLWLLIECKTLEISVSTVSTGWKEVFTVPENEICIPLVVHAIVTGKLPSNLY